MTAGKRCSTAEPLTEHDVADRLDKAALRLLRILMDTRQAEGDLYADVRRSRYLTNGLDLLIEELGHWQ